MTEKNKDNDCDVALSIEYILIQAAVTFNNLGVAEIKYGAFEEATRNLKAAIGTMQTYIENKNDLIPFYDAIKEKQSIALKELDVLSSHDKSIFTGCIDFSFNRSNVSETVTAIETHTSISDLNAIFVNSSDLRDPNTDDVKLLITIVMYNLGISMLLNGCHFEHDREHNDDIDDFHNSCARFHEDHIEFDNSWYDDALYENQEVDARKLFESSLEMLFSLKVQAKEGSKKHFHILSVSVIILSSILHITEYYDHTHQHYYLRPTEDKAFHNMLNDSLRKLKNSLS